MEFPSFLCVTTSFCVYLAAKFRDCFFFKQWVFELIDVCRRWRKSLCQNERAEMRQNDRFSHRIITMSLWLLLYNTRSHRQIFFLFSILFCGWYFFHSLYTLSKWRWSQTEMNIQVCFGFFFVKPWPTCYDDSWQKMSHCQTFAAHQHANI